MAEEEADGEPVTDESHDEAGAKAESEGATREGGLDVEAERGRLDEVGEQIEQGRRALADLEGDTDPEPDGPPIASGEGAANAPPG